MEYENTEPPSISNLMTRFRNKQISLRPAEEEIKAAMIAGGATEKQAGKAMYLAYERGHSAGHEEVLNAALGLLDIWTE